MAERLGKNRYNCFNGSHNLKGFTVHARYLYFDSFGVEKLLILGEVFKFEFLIELHVLRAPELKCYGFSCWFGCLDVNLFQQDKKRQIIDN